jgi:hypothetical protein
MLYSALVRYKLEHTSVAWNSFKISDSNKLKRIRMLFATKEFSKLCNITYLLTYRAETFLRSCQLCSPSRTPQLFMEAGGSIPCSQEPSTGPYPEPYQSNPLHPILSLLRPILILSNHLRLGLPSGLFPSRIPTNNLCAFLFSPILATCSAHLILLDLIIFISFQFLNLRQSVGFLGWGISPS